MDLFNRDQFIQLQMFLYRVIVASAPLLEAAIPKARGEVGQYYRKHLAEETGHDRMMLADLVAMDVMEIPYFPLAAQLAGSQYYLIHHDDPVALLGYMLVLEDSIWTVPLVEELQSFYGVELTCLMHHAKHDPFHSDDLRHMIETAGKGSMEKIKLNYSSSKALIELQIGLIGAYHGNSNLRAA